MRRQQYLEHKRSQKDQLDSISRRQSCFVCYRPIESCLCEHIKPFQTNTTFIFLMHPKEAKKQRLGTGRMTHATLVNSKIIVAENVDTSEIFCSLIEDSQNDCFLLYPAGDALILGEEKDKAEFTRNNKQIIFILDATWPCAKKMMRLSKKLKAMKKVSFNGSYRSEFRIKHQPHECCLSTIESTKVTLDHLINWQIENCDHSKLLEPFHAMINFQIECALDPDRESSRGKKPQTLPKEGRVRPKTHRLFFWDTDKSHVGSNKLKIED